MRRRAKDYGQKGFDFMKSKRYEDAAEMFFRALHAGTSEVAYRDFLDPWKVIELEGALGRAREMAAMAGNAEQQHQRVRVARAAADVEEVKVAAAAADGGAAARREAAVMEARRRAAEAVLMDRLRTAEAAGPFSTEGHRT